MEKKLRQYLPGGKFKGVSAARSRHMATIRGTNTRSTEKRLRFAMVRAGIRGWCLNAPDVLGRPDFYFREAKLAVFVDGCFWHGCPQCGHYPKTRRKFWKAKIDRTRERDRQKARGLRKQGIRVVRFWEHELKESPSSCVERIAVALDRPT